MKTVKICKACKGTGKTKIYLKAEYPYWNQDSTIYDYELTRCLSCGGSGKSK